MFVSAMDAPATIAVVAMHEGGDADRRPVLRPPVQLQVRPARRRAELRHADLRQQLPRPGSGLEDTREELRRRNDALPVGAPDRHLGTEGEHHRGQIRRRVAVGERAADRSDMPHLRIADHARRRRHDRAVLLQERIVANRFVPRERADRELRAGIPDIRELGQPADVDRAWKDARSCSFKAGISECPPASSFASSSARSSSIAWSTLSASS